MARRDDTIVAVSSPPGRSRRGLLRLSGSEALCVVDAMTGDASGGGAGRRAHSAPRTLTVCRVRVTSDGAALPMLVARFDGPRSFTGQDMAELQCPGHPALLDRLVHRATELGARLAEPGEFTFRAFLAGKLDLTQAEGIAATIAARSDGQLQAATLLRRGALGRFAAAVVDELATQLALVEAGIDFVDAEDVVPIGPGALDDALARIAGRLASLSSRSRSWGAIEALPRVVLVGPPSAGKSTLFNALLGRRRAVVSPMPGTTRDVLAEPMTITSDGGRQVEVMLVDVAGLDAPGDALNEQVQAAARRAIEGADLIVNVNDGRAGQHRGDAAVLDSTEMAPRGTAVVCVRSKGDLSGPAPGGAARLSGPRPGARSAAQLTVSALTGEGVSALSAAIAGAMGRRGVSVAADMLALQPRHEAALRAAADHLDQARRLLAPQRQAHAIGGAELVAGALRAALDALAGLGGQMSPDDVIGRVFATFCVGK